MSIKRNVGRKVLHSIFLVSVLFWIFVSFSAFAAEIIIDNRDSETFQTGTWSVSGADDPYGVDSVWSRDGDTFTWYFTPTVTGNHNVSIRYTGWPSRSTSVPVIIEYADAGGATTATTVPINQQEYVGEWYPLGSYYFVMGTTYSVTITAQPGPSSTCADAVKFDSISIGAPPSAFIDSITPNPADSGESIQFTGHGEDDGDVVAYHWESSLSGQIGETASIDTALADGIHNISFTVQDNDGNWSEAASEVLVVGTPPSEIIIDNRDSETFQTGTWSVSGADDPYGVDSVWSRDGDTFTWYFTPTVTGNHNVSIRYTGWPSRSTSVPVIIEYADAGGATTATTVPINQQEYVGEWYPLGSYYFVMGTTYSVTITAQPGPSSTSADAVRFTGGGGGTVNSPPVALDDPFKIVVDTSDNILNVLSNDFDPDPGDTMTITAVDDPDQGGTCAINATGDAILYSPLAGFTGIETFTYGIQDLAGAPATATVTVTVLESNEMIIDNGDPETSFQGEWNISGGPDPYGVDSVWSRDGSTYTWAFTPTMSGNYQVFMWWTEWPSRTIVSVDIYHSGEGGVSKVDIDQQQNGGGWNPLGIYPFEFDSLNAGATYNVTITTAPGPYSTSADAVRFVFDSPLEISGASPENNAQNIDLNPLLEAEIRESNGGPIDWSMELFNGTSWDVLDSGTEADGELSVAYQTTTVDQHETQYTWKVAFTDSLGELTERVFSFTTESAPTNYDPSFSGRIPRNAATDVELNPTLQVRIYDRNDDSIDWSIELFNGATWDELDAGVIPNGDETVYVDTTTITEYETEYMWKVRATDPSGSGRTDERVYYFTTMADPLSPISSPHPKSGETGVPLDTTLSASVDTGGMQMDITFSIYNGSFWQTLQSFYGQTSGTYEADASSYITEPETDYSWRVTVDDSSGNVTEKTFSFTTSGGFLRHKYTTNLTYLGQILPVMGDIDNDGDQEIVMATDEQIVAVNGKTGVIEWTVPIRMGQQGVELADLDNDGTPEVLYADKGANSNPVLIALNGNGSLRWTSQQLGGDYVSLFPIMASDIDGDGYPTLYLATEDTNPDPYDGDPSHYDGALNMLDHNGNLLAYTWIHHPCWGGMSLADADSDGQFEIYLSDRRTGYHDYPAQGVQAFNAHTLEPIWARPDLQHSSPIPVVADVNKDGILDIVATPITNAGPVVLDALTGSNMYDYSNRSLRTHGTPTVYDVDGDGNLEWVSATSYPSSAPKQFLVFDLIKGTVDFQANFDEWWIAWPPKMGDVTGDGHMEILVATGNQPDVVGDIPGASYPLLIYDKNFKLIERVEMPNGTGQLTPARIYDVDSDGYGELVVAGYRGKLMVYDTDAPTPSPAPRTWLQFYGEYRQGAAEYVAPPGP